MIPYPINPNILMGALNWFLGKSGISTHDFCNWLVINWDTIDDHTKLLILNKVEDLIILDNKARSNRDHQCVLPLGSSEARAAWENIASLKEQTTPRNGLVILNR